MSFTPFVFTLYTEMELVACGDAFLVDCTTKEIWSQRDTTWWTEHVLNWFARTAREGVSVNARKDQQAERIAHEAAPPARATKGEWLVDLIHTSYPSDVGPGYWRGLLDESNRDGPDWTILLALESEWGRLDSPPLRREMVLDDASKLTALRSAVKVLVTSMPKEHAISLERDLEVLRKRTGDDAPWLWINLPPEMTPDNCQYVMFGKQRKIRNIRRERST